MSVRLPKFIVCGVFLTFIGCPSFLKAQGISDYLYYGIKAGANYTWFSNNQPHTSGKTGYTAGLTVEMRRWHRFFLVSGISYQREGGRYVEIVNNSEAYLRNYVGSNNISLHNLDIPLLARVFLRNGKQFLPYLVAGPSLVINLAANNYFERSLNYTNGRLTYNGFTDLSSRFNQFSGLINAGLGSEVLIANESILFEVSFRYGLTPANPDFSFLSGNKAGYPLYVDGVQFNIAYNF